MYVEFYFRSNVLVLFAFRLVDVHGIVLQRNPGPFPTMARGYQ